MSYQVRKPVVAIADGVDVTDGPDRAYLRSLPVEFNNLSLWGGLSVPIRHLHSGLVVTAGTEARANPATFTADGE